MNRLGSNTKATIHSDLFDSTSSFLNTEISFGDGSRLLNWLPGGSFEESVPLTRLERALHAPILDGGIAGRPTLVV